MTDTELVSITITRTQFDILCGLVFLGYANIFKTDYTQSRQDEVKTATKQLLLLNDVSVINKLMADLRIGLEIKHG